MGSGSGVRLLRCLPLLGLAASALLACAHGRRPRPTRPERVVLGATVTGRYLVEVGEVEADAGQPSIRLPYSNAELAFRFDGTALDLCGQDLPGAAVADRGTRFRLLLDDVVMPPLVLRQGQHCYPLARGLRPTTHRVVLQKETESVVGEARLWWPPALRVVPYNRFVTRNIVAIGDSITCAYGIRCRGPEGHFDPRDEDATRSYVAQAARALAASLEVVAVSGRGVSRNRIADNEPTLPVLFGRNLPGDTDGLPQRQPRAWADAVVINLGTNDLAFGHTKGAAPLDEAAFLAAYERLLAAAELDSPRAAFFLCVSPMVSDTWPAKAGERTQLTRLLNEVVHRLQARGRRAMVVDFGVQGEGRLAESGFGCDYHPSEVTHQVMGEVLAAAMGRTLHWRRTLP